MMIEFNFYDGDLQASDNLSTTLTEYSELSLSNNTQSSNDMKNETIDEFMRILDDSEYFYDNEASLDETNYKDSVKSNQSLVSSKSNEDLNSTSRFKRFFQKSRSTEDIPSLDTKLTTRKGKIFSHRSKLGYLEFTEFAASFFKTGWNLSKMEMLRSLAFTSKFYSKYHAQ